MSTQGQTKRDGEMIIITLPNSDIKKVGSLVTAELVKAITNLCKGVELC